MSKPDDRLVPSPFTLLKNASPGTMEVFVYIHRDGEDMSATARLPYFYANHKSLDRKSTEWGKRLAYEIIEFASKIEESARLREEQEAGFEHSD